MRAKRFRKYGNVPTVVDGIRFDSKKEAGRYAELKILDDDGAIENLVCQPRFEIRVNGVLVCRYVADFSYSADGCEVVEDVKSSATKTAAYRLKKKLMWAVHGVDVVEV